MIVYWSKRFRWTGTGTFEEPVSFAAANGVFEPCEKIYIPYLKKYARYEDYCAACRRLIVLIDSLRVGYTRGELRRVLSREPKGGSWYYQNWCVDRIQYKWRWRPASMRRKTYNWTWSDNYARNRLGSWSRRLVFLSIETNLSLYALLVSFIFICLKHRG